MTPRPSTGTNGPPAALVAWRGEVDDGELDDLHAAAFGHERRHRSWRSQLVAHSVGWVTARRGERLVGFVNVAWDGEQHAFLVDAIVAPDEQGAGLGEVLVRRAVDGARAAGCSWLHVDFEAPLASFYIERCAFTPTSAGVRALRSG